MGSALIKLWPDKDDGRPGHPTPKQRLLWCEEMPPAGTDACQCPACLQSFSIPTVSPHQHDLDVICVLGATGAGKTFGVVRRLVWLARKYPGCRIAVGSISFSHAETTVIVDWAEFFTHPITGEQWKHPWLIGSKPSKNKRWIKINCGKKKPISEVHFLNLTEFNKLLGTKFDVVHCEEAQNIKSADPIELIVTRMRSKMIPRKQIILTGNPTEELGWLVDWFKLEQLNEKHEGEIQPVGKACHCHRCAKCRSRLKKIGKSEEDAPLYDEDKICPLCKYKRRFPCPGNQHFQRVVEVSIDDNFENLPEGYQGNIFSMLREDQAERLGRGKYVKKVSGLCYPSFGRDNVIKNDKTTAGKLIYPLREIEIDRSKDLIWHLDFNERPQCSGISQEKVIDGVVHLFTIDEIIEWDVRAKEVADAFVKKYEHLLKEGFRNRVLVYGDPNGWQGDRQKTESKANFYQIAKVLKFAGFRPVLMQPRTVYPVKLRIDSVNKMMRDNDLVRWHINERCVFHIKSAENVEWNNKGTLERDNEDIKCRNKGKEGQTWSLTHPLAGAGYYIVQEHPETPHGIIGGPRPIIIGTGTGVVTETDDHGVLKTRRIHSVLNDPNDDYSEDDEEIEDEFDGEEDGEEFHSRRPTMFGSRKSIADQLRQFGQWGLRRPF